MDSRPHHLVLVSKGSHGLPAATGAAAPSPTRTSSLEDGMGLLQGPLTSPTAHPSHLPEPPSPQSYPGKDRGPRYLFVTGLRGLAQPRHVSQLPELPVHLGQGGPQSLLLGGLQLLLQEAMGKMGLLTQEAPALPGPVPHRELGRRLVASSTVPGCGARSPGPFRAGSAGLTPDLGQLPRDS